MEEYILKDVRVKHVPGMFCEEGNGKATTLELKSDTELSETQA